MNIKILFVIAIIASLISCNPNNTFKIDQAILSHLGEKHKTGFLEMANSFEEEIKKDSTNTEAYLGVADSYIMLFLFGYIPRDEAVPKAKFAYEQAVKLSPNNSDVVKLSGILNFLDWKWKESQIDFEKSIQINPKNKNARHWYSLWHSAMGDFESAMAQSDTIMTMDTAGDYLVGRGSLLYFQYRFEEMKPIMLENIHQHPEVPWGYDWLGMAYNGLGEHEEALNTYFKAFELSDGTVEVGAGLGHALGNARETKLAKQMADYYEIAAKNSYLPPVQRSFIHLGIGEYDKAIELLEQAYQEQSWFLIFIQIEHWYDPIRSDERFKEIMNKMNFDN